MLASELLAKLQGVRGSGPWTALCPAHDDRRQSLSVTEGNSRLLIKCHAGCSFDAITSALSLSARDLRTDTPTPPSASIAAEYGYADESGRELFQVVRLNPKNFRQRHRNERSEWVWNMAQVRRVPYHLPQLIRAVEARQPVFVVEGEKDVESLESHELVATCNPGGAGKWRPEFAEYFQGASVYILPDNDEPGRRHAQQVASELSAVTADVRIVELPKLQPKNDVTDWLCQGGTKAQLLELATSAPLYERKALAGANPNERTRLDIRTLSQWRDHPELWAPPPAIVPNVLYSGAVTLISAREKMGKTTFGAQMVATVSRGGTFLGNQVRQGRVLWFAMDEALGDTLRRFLRLGADDGLLVTSERPASLEAYREAINEHRPAVIVFDSLGDLWEGKVDSNSHDDTRAFLKPFVRESRTVGAAVVAIYHTNASATKYAGAVAIGAMVDAPLLLKGRGEARDENGEDLPDDGRRLLEGRTRFGAVRIPLTYRNGNYELGDDPPSLRTKALQALAAQPQSQNTLRDALGCQKARLGDVVRELVAVGLVQRRANSLEVTQAGMRELAGTDAEPVGTTQEPPTLSGATEVVPLTRPGHNRGNHFTDDDLGVAV